MPIEAGAEPKFIYEPRQQKVILAAGALVGLAALVALSTRMLIDQPDARSQALLTWGLAGLPIGIPMLVTSIRPLVSGADVNRRFWRWWIAGDVAAVSATSSVAINYRGAGTGLPTVTLVLGAMVLPFWATGGVIMLRQKSGARTVGIDLVDTAVAVITVSAIGAYVLITPILGAQESVIAVPLALCMVGAPAGLYLAITNFLRLQAGYRTPQGIAIAVAAAMYSNIGYQAVNAVHDFNLPPVPGVGLQLLAGYLLLALPLFSHRNETPGLDRLPLMGQVRRPSPLIFVPLVIFPFLGFAAWNERAEHPSRMTFVIAVMFNILILQSVRSLLANRETVRLYAELEAASVELEHRASHDELTGLINRRRFTEVIDDAIARQRRSHGPLAVLFVDLDGFKKVNDSLGHRAGDDVLREVAARLRTAVRHSDTVARLGGDEFVLLCESAGTVAEAETIAARVVADLADPIVTSAGPATLGASVGVAYTVPGTAMRTDDLLRQADEAMYDAKQAGRSQVRTRVLTDGVAPRDQVSSP